MMTEKDILEVRDVQTADKPQHETVRKLCNELLAARRQVGPVLDWYQPDDQPARPFEGILKDMVADLQTDRAELLDAQRLLKQIAVQSLTLCRCLPRDNPHRQAYQLWLVDNHLMPTTLRGEQPSVAVRKAIGRFHSKLAELQESPTYAVGSPQWAHEVTDRVVRRVAELPDRTSPDNWPEAMLVTADELREIIAEETRRPAHVAETGE